MDPVNKTLYIPLYGKALVSRQGILLRDETAQAIWDREGFPLKGKAASPWLAKNMGMRARVFDRWLEEQLVRAPQSTVLHLGCGLDSRCLRVKHPGGLWFDADFPEVIAERSRYFTASETYRMVPCDLRQEAWLEALPRGGDAIVVMEGVSMYLRREELTGLLAALTARFRRVRLLADVYTEFGAKASKYKNPINEVGVTRVYGVDDPRCLTEGTGLKFLREWDLTPEDLIRELPKKEQGFFRTMFAGGLAKKIYRLWEFGTEGIDN